MTSLLDDLQVFWGEVNEHSARIYVTTGADPLDGSRMLQGVVKGPFAPTGETLPARFFLQDLPGDSLLAATVVTDPCYWTPLHPATYRVTVELREQQQTIEQVERTLAIRPLGPRGNSFYFGGDRFVLRALAPPAEMAWLRETGAAMWIDRWDPAVCDEALRSGVRVVLDARKLELPGVLAGVRRSPAVIAVVVDQSQADACDGDPRPLSLSTVFGVNLSADSSLPRQLPPWAGFGLAQADRLSSLATPPNYAVAAYTPASGEAADRRAAVDRLQADLAHVGQFAGYVALDQG